MSTKIYASDDIKITDSPELTKMDIRKRVWDHLVKKELAKFPFPPHHRIPNFKGAKEAGQKMAKLSIFTSATTVKVNPDKPQEEVRFSALEQRKRLLVPTPRLQSGLFNLLVNDGNEYKDSLRFKSSAGGVKSMSKPISLNDHISVDLIVIGSVAVSVTGRRIGKGEGFADLEYAMMKTMKAINDNTKIITTVHDCQVFDDLPFDLFASHDVPVDVIVTPTRVIEVKHQIPKPRWIYWNLLNFEKFKQIPILEVLRNIDKKNGRDTTLQSQIEDLEETKRYTMNNATNYDQRRENFRTRVYRNQNVQSGYGKQKESDGFKSSNKNYTKVLNQNIVVEEPKHYRQPQKNRKTAQPAVDTASQKDLVDIQNSPPIRSIQVTINVDKQNKVVRRKVETVTESDRVANANLSEEDDDHEVAEDRIFSVFIGKIPVNTRYADLKAAVQQKSVQPSKLYWRKGNSYAFLKFINSDQSREEVIENLEHLCINDKNLAVAAAKSP